MKSKEDLIQAIYRQYPTVLNCFKNQNPVTKLWRSFNCDIIPFTVGLFCRTCDNKEMFQPGLDTYPKQLWEAISHYWNQQDQQCREQHENSSNDKPGIDSKMLRKNTLRTKSDGTKEVRKSSKYSMSYEF